MKRVERDSEPLPERKKPVREGWAEDSKAIADAGDDKLVWPEFPNEDDKFLEW
jgi:antitoxin MazE